MIWDFHRGSDGELASRDAAVVAGDCFGDVEGYLLFRAECHHALGEEFVLETAAGNERFARASGALELCDFFDNEAREGFVNLRGDLRRGHAGAQVGEDAFEEGEGGDGGRVFPGSAKILLGGFAEWVRAPATFCQLGAPSGGGGGW